MLSSNRELIGNVSDNVSHSIPVKNLSPQQSRGNKAPPCSLEPCRGSLPQQSPHHDFNLNILHHVMWAFITRGLLVWVHVKTGTHDSFGVMHN